ncbi:FixH family protein [Acuticoccus sp. I52.16.1]|uniref:FixH family protein n=1 Tax=Acuticoccus sp. I52.16.1 TaxID=2928472 RepID=UPI001FD11A9A|nr:FixH family protein [Acuticoccus sp. I52.16.1]UOM34042.1 FixH family protein [Acuticoccus sp. I52.16.1]
MAIVKREREFTGLHMLLIMVAFFGVVIAVNVVMAVLANTTFTGLTARNGYVASIDYKKDIENRARAAELGWTVAVVADRHRIGVDLTDAAGAPLVAVVSGTIEPLVKHDPPLPLEFAAVSAGRYRAVSPVPPGEWVVRVGIEHGGERLAWHAPVETVTP